MLLFLVNPAYALDITGGFISVLFQGSNTTTSINGPGFSAFAFDDDHIFFFGEPSGSVLFSGPIPGNSPIDQRALVTVGTDTCNGLSVFASCGQLTISAPAIPLSERVLGASTAPVPFTATGHLNVGPGYDVVGQGTVTATYNTSVSLPDFHYTFAAESSPVLAVPELSILRRLSPRHLYGRELAALANPSLQRTTAWGAACVLNAVQIPARQRAEFIDLPHVRLEVQEWCSGLVSMKWFLLLSVGIALAVPVSIPWKIALIFAAPLIALEVNILRVAGIGISVEWLHADGWGPMKEWLAWVATGLGVAQVVGLGRWIATTSRIDRSHSHGGISSVVGAALGSARHRRDCPRSAGQGFLRERASPIAASAPRRGRLARSLAERQLTHQDSVVVTRTASWFSLAAASIWAERRTSRTSS